MDEGSKRTTETKTDITLYEFYSICIGKLLERSPWELERAVSAYHESFLTEQRCLGLSMLVLMGEDHVATKNLKGMPGFEEQTRASVNQAVFLRALKRYFEQKSLNPVRANMVIERMGGYIEESKLANKAKKSPLEAMTELVARRVPPKNAKQRDQYALRVSKIFDYIEGLVSNNVLVRYKITD